MPNVTTPTDYTLNYRPPPVRLGVRCGCFTASNPKAPDPPQHPDDAKATPTNSNISASPGAASWSPESGPTKTLDDHRAERSEFVRQLLQQVGIQPTHGPDDGPYLWERTTPADPDVPSRPVLLLRAVAERQRWKAEYTAAQLATGDPPPANHSATRDQAA